MIDVLKAKLEKSEAPHNVQPVCVLLEDPDDKALLSASQHDRDGPRLRYDLILNHLVLHHIGDLEGVLRTMLGCVKKVGSVALTDFEDFGPAGQEIPPEGEDGRG